MSLPLSVRSSALTFLSFAMPVSMFGVIWPDVRERFDQSLGALGVVSLVYGIARLSTSGAGRRVTCRIGIGPAFVGGLVGLVFADLLTAIAAGWVMFLAGVAAIGVVSGLLDSVGAGVIATLEDIGSAGTIHGAYGLGATLGPLVVVAIPGWRWSLVASAAVGLVALGLAVAARSSFPAASVPTTADVGASSGSKPPSGPTAMSLLLFFSFIAAEVTVGNWLFTYLTETRGIGETVARFAVSGFWGGTMAGRLVLAADGVRHRVERLGLPAAAGIATAFVGVTVVAPGPSVIVTSTVIGLGLAPIVPTLSARTASRVGAEHAQQVSGWQLLAANVGAIGVPFVTGAIIDATTASAVPIVTLVVLTAGVPLLVAARRTTSPSTVDA